MKTILVKAELILAIILCFLIFAPVISICLGLLEFVKQLKIAYKDFWFCFKDDWNHPSK